MLFVCFIIFFIFATLLSLYFAFMVDGPAPVVVAIFILVFYFVIFGRVVFLWSTGRSRHMGICICMCVGIILGISKDLPDPGNLEQI